MGEGKRKLMWIEEDVHQLEAYKSAFERLNYDVQEFVCATSAWRFLSSASTEQLSGYSLFIIDVMLRPGDNTQLFDLRRTRTNLVTGLILVEEVAQANPLALARLRECAVLYTSAVDPDLREEIEKFGAEHGLRHAWRDANVDAMTWAKQVLISVEKRAS